MKKRIRADVVGMVDGTYNTYISMIVVGMIGVAISVLFYADRHHAEREDGRRRG